MLKASQNTKLVLNAVFEQYGDYINGGLTIGGGLLLTYASGGGAIVAMSAWEAGAAAGAMVLGLTSTALGTAKVIGSAMGGSEAVEGLPGTYSGVMAMPADELLGNENREIEKTADLIQNVVTLKMSSNIGNPIADNISKTIGVYDVIQSYNQVKQSFEQEENILQNTVPDFINFSPQR